MSKRGPKASRPERKKVAEDARTETFEANAEACAGIALGLHDTLVRAGAEFELSPEDQILSACLAVAMLVKSHQMVEASALRVLAQCIRGTHLIPFGSTGGTS